MTATDPHLRDAAILVTTTQFATPDRLQRHLRIGYATAANLLDELEQHGIVGPAQGTLPRNVLANPGDLNRLLDGAR